MWNYDKKVSGEEVKFYIILGISSAMGIIAAVFFLTVKRLAVFMTTCCFGVFLALQIYIFLAFYVEQARTKVVCFYLARADCSLRCAWNWTRTY